MNFNQNRGSIFSSLPPVTKNLIIINALCWLAAVVFKHRGIDLNNLLGLHYVGASDFNLAQFVTYMFMHDTGSITHLFFNMFSVFMFGRTIEAVWGSKRFLIYYFVTGIGAALIQQLAWTFEFRELLFGGYEVVNLGGLRGAVSRADFLNMMVTVGASGSVFGILLAFGMLFPNAPLYLMFIPIPIKAKYFVIFYGVIELFSGVHNFRGDNVAHFAHLGGMLFGIILILYWRKKGGNYGQRYF